MKALRITALAAVALLATAAHAGRPLQTEDAGVLAPGDCEIESYAARERVPGEPTARESSMQLSCGLPAATQLGLQFARGRAGTDRSDDINLVGKTALRELGEDNAGFVLAYALGSSKASGANFRYAGHQVKAVATFPVGPWLLHGNLGWAHARETRTNSTIWALAAERTGLGAFDAMSEVFGDDRAAPWWNVGVRFTAIEKSLFVDASYGRQMTGGRPKLVTVGLKFAF